MIYILTAIAFLTCCATMGPAPSFGLVVLAIAFGVLR